MLNWSERKRIAVIATVYFVIADLVSWLTSRGPLCVVNPQDYGEYYSKNNECPTYHVFLIKFATSILESLGHNWTTAIGGLIVAWFTFELARLGRRQSSDTRILQRAYLSVQPAGVAPYPSGDELISYDIDVLNAGNLPAEKVSWSIGKMLSVHSNETESSFRYPPQEGNVIIPPKVKMRKGGLAITFKEFDDFNPEGRPRERWLYVFGRVEYLDGFDKKNRRWIEFCHRYNLRAAAGGSRTIKRKHARFHIHGNHSSEHS